jgi:peroxiredoxin
MSLLRFISRLFGGPQMEAVSAGSRAPAFTLRDFEGKSHSLEQVLKKGPVLLAFFKGSCPTCQFTFPFLVRLHQGIEDGNHVQVWGISQNGAGDTRAFARELGIRFPLLLDEDGYAVSNAYGITNVPTLFLVAPDGSVRLSGMGFSRRDIETVAAAFSRQQTQPINVFQPGEVIPDYKPG